MQSKHVARKMPAPFPCSEKSQSLSEQPAEIPVALSNETLTSLFTIFKLPLVISLHLQRRRPQQSRRKCGFCCFLAHFSAWFYQAAAQHFCPERSLCDLDTILQSHTGSSYVSPIKLSSPAFIPAKEVQAEIRSHSS